MRESALSLQLIFLPIFKKHNRAGVLALEHSIVGSISLHIGINVDPQTVAAITGLRPERLPPSHIMS